MELLVATILGGLLLLLGLIGCVVPVLLGPLCAYAALWVLVAFGATPGSTPLTVGAVVLILATVADYVFPAIFAQKFKCSKTGVFGCFIGTIVGLFFLPLGIEPVRADGDGGELQHQTHDEAQQRTDAALERPPSVRPMISSPHIVPRNGPATESQRFSEEIGRNYGIGKGNVAFTSFV